MIASNKAEDAGPSSVAVPTWQSVRTLRSLADLIDRRPALVLPIWIIVYFAVLWRAAHRPLWYDELFTYYVSTAPTWAKFMGGMKFVDLNPPLSYLFVRSSIALFGDSPFATRLPSLLGFLAASLIVYVLITRRLGGGLGLAALGFLWSFSLTGYAVEARPYRHQLCFFSVGMLCWLNAAEASRWTKWHAGLTVAIGAMLVTHCFSPVLVAAIGVGELVRNIVRKRIDKKVWAALLAPLSLVLIYLPLVRNAQSLSMPRSFQATLSTIPLFFVRISFSALPAIGVILVLWLIRGKGTVKVRLRDLAQPHEIAFCFAALFLPTAIIGYCIWSGVAFWERYGIGAALGGCLMLTALLAMATRRNVRASVAAAAVILILFCLTKARTQRLVEQQENASPAYRMIHSELPFVAACGLTFLDMDHRESPEFVNRLYYLTDRKSALFYVHATAFEGYPTIQKWFPIRGNVLPYQEFVKHNRQFLVLTASDCPLDWLLFKLRDDGAQIRLLQNLKTGYYDHELYEVTLRE